MPHSDSLTHKILFLYEPLADTLNINNNYNVYIIFITDKGAHGSVEIPYGIHVHSLMVLFFFHPRVSTEISIKPQACVAYQPLSGLAGSLSVGLIVC